MMPTLDHEAKFRGKAPQWLDYEFIPEAIRSGLCGEACRTCAGFLPLVLTTTTAHAYVLIAFGACTGEQEFRRYISFAEAPSLQRIPEFVIYPNIVSVSP
jgi:hypothetical protein